MPSYYEALPINKAAMELAVVAVAMEDSESCGNVKWRHHAYIFERPVATEEDVETPR